MFWPGSESLAPPGQNSRREKGPFDHFRVGVRRGRGGESLSHADSELVKRDAPRLGRGPVPRALAARRRLRPIAMIMRMD
jgi:hypothetical protein